MPEVFLLKASNATVKGNLPWIHYVNSLCQDLEVSSLIATVTTALVKSVRITEAILEREHLSTDNRRNTKSTHRIAVQLERSMPREATVLSCRELWLE